MYRATRIHIPAITLMAGFLAAPALFAAPKTLKRVDDPVVVDCGEMAPLFRSPVERLSLMAFSEEQWEPVPFQIDQKKPDGSYAFTMGPEASRDPDPGLDANDELVFMVKDTGDRMEGGEWPAGAEAVMEIEVTDPNDGGEAWLYLVRFSGAGPRSPEDYIRVEVDRQAQYRKVVTYEYVMGGPMDRMYPDYLAARKLANGKPGLDVLDRLKMRGEVDLPLGISIPFSMDELLRSEDKGWIDGPVRVLHLADGYIEVARYIKIKGSGYSLISYYVNYVIWPMVMQVPVSQRGLVQINDFRGYMDFNSNVYGSHPFSAANPLNPDVVFDGHMSEAEKNLDSETNIDWIAGFGPQGALVSRLFFRPDPPDRIQRLYFFDDETVDDPPEDHPGMAASGYTLMNLESEEGEEPITSYQYYFFLSTLEPGEVGRVLDILDHPVKVTVRAVE